MKTLHKEPVESPTKTEESIFIQMHKGTRTGEGSFNQGLKQLFYTADHSNRIKLVKAFPEFFGNSVLEFNIYPDKTE